VDSLEAKLNVVIFTDNYRISGEISHFSDMRLTDFMVEAKSFVAVTNATIIDKKNNESYSSPFINVQRDKIEIIIPADDLKSD